VTDDQGVSGVEGNGQGVETYTDNVNPDIDMDSDPFLLAGHDRGLDNHDGPVHSEHDSTKAETCQRYAREFDEGCATDVLGSAKTAFESMKDLQEASGQGAYAPFADQSEWELADWLVKNVNQRATDEFLKLLIVSHINPCSE
jgi:hypothetical protein